MCRKENSHHQQDGDDGVRNAGRPRELMIGLRGVGEGEVGGGGLGGGGAEGGRGGGEGEADDGRE